MRTLGVPDVKFILLRQHFVTVKHNTGCKRLKSKPTGYPSGGERQFYLMVRAEGWTVQKHDMVLVVGHFMHTEVVT